MTKNEKISKSLKLHYRTKKTIKSVKKISIFIAIVMWVSFLAGAEAKAPEARQWGLPVSGDREMSVRERIYEEVKRSNHPEWADYIYKLSYWESIKICGEEAETCKNDKGNNPAHSTDRGVLMINDYWHSEISDECAYNIECSVAFTIDMIAQGRQSEWVADKYVKGVPLAVVIQ